MKDKDRSSRKYLSVFLVILLCGILLSWTSQNSFSQDNFTLVYTCHDPPGGFIANYSEKMFDEIKKKTGGKIQVESHYGGELAQGFNEAYQLVIQGMADIGFITPIEIPGQFGLNSLIVFSDWNVRSRRGQVWTEIYNKFPEIRDEWKKVKVLSLAANSEGSLGSRIPLRTLEDCKGRKYVGAGEILSKKLAALGFVPVTVSPPDTFMSIQTGLVEGVNMTWYYWRDFGLHQIMPYVTRVPLSQYPYAWVINLEKWNKLPPDIQKTINDMFETGYFAKMWDDMLWAVDESIRAEAASKYGATIIELSADETAKWEKLVDGVAEKMATELEAKGLPAKKVLEEIYRLENEYAIVKIQ